MHIRWLIHAEKSGIGALQLAVCALGRSLLRAATLAASGHQRMFSARGVRMHALRLGALVLQCLLGLSCFLDESPTRRAYPGKSADSVSKPSPFVPRDIEVPGRAARAGSSGSSGQPVTSTRPSVPQATADAGAMTAQGTPPDTQAMTDAGAPPLPDAGAVRDAGSANGNDAQIAQDASDSRTRDADVAQDAAAPSDMQLPQPIHRYDFSGNDRVVVDRIGDADAELRGSAQLTGSGEVQLGATEQDAVALPSGTLAGMQSFTMIGWLTVRSNECWQRLVDFLYYSEQTSPDGQVATQASRLYLTPISCPDGLPTAGYVTQQSVARAQGGEPLSDQPKSLMLGGMFDARRQRLQLIVDGVVEAEVTAQINHRQLERARARLGTSFDNSHPVLKGNISEFRIYAQTLDAETIRELARRGPDLL